MELRVSREAGPITGYRVWRLLMVWHLLTDPSDMKAVPTGGLWGAYGTLWCSPVLRAECYRQHAAPQADCVCGIYAVRRWESLPDTVFRQKFRFAVPDTVLYVPGAVRLEGRIIEHEDGWRGEYATMEWLVVPDARPELGWPSDLRDLVRAQLRRLYPEVPVLEGEVADEHR